MWPSSWGTKPGTLEEREARVRELVNAAPKLIPVYQHRYLLAEPCQAGNPVLSIWGTAMIIYSVDLRRYLLDDFSDLVGTDKDDYAWRTPERYEEFKKIPF